jgi:F1F0 ATPase subunit 2
MNEPLIWIASVIWGVTLGGFFFGGLLWTVRKAVASNRPALWLIGSLIIRMGALLTGFYVMSYGDWKRLILCFVGFFLGRSLVIRLTRGLQIPVLLDEEENHAP